MRYIRTRDLWTIAVTWFVLDFLRIGLAGRLPQWALVRDAQGTISDDVVVVVFVCLAQLFFGRRGDK